MKQSLASAERVVEEVKRSIAESLRINPQSITPEKSLVQDLGAESLDFLDINYRLEHAFGIRMARQLVLEHVEEMFGEGSAVDESGRLTEKGAKLLKIRWGDHSSNIRSGMELDQVTALITVQTMARGVMDILDTLPETCPACAAAIWQSQNGTRISCGACRKDAPFTNGDDLIRQWLTNVQQDKNIF